MAKAEPTKNYDNTSQEYNLKEFKDFKNIENSQDFFQIAKKIAMEINPNILFFSKWCFPVYFAI